jgi:hypothetical protein
LKSEPEGDEVEFYEAAEQVSGRSDIEEDE